MTNPTENPSTPAAVATKAPRAAALEAACEEARGIDLSDCDNLAMYFHDETNRALENACTHLFVESELFDSYRVVAYYEEPGQDSWDASLILVADDLDAARSTQLCRIVGVDLSDYRDTEGILRFVEQIDYELQQLARDVKVGL